MIINPIPRNVPMPHVVLEQIPDVADHAAPDPGAVEPKVRAATAAASSSAAVLLPFVLWLLGTYLFHGDVPIPVQGMTGLVITGLSTFAAGYAARHVNRNTAP
jgi:hypothetical protein